MVPGMRFYGMQTGTTLPVTPADRARLEAIISHPATAQKHVRRCRIVLLSADRLGTMAIVAATGKSKKCVWRWQDRYVSDEPLGDLQRPRQAHEHGRKLLLSPAQHGSGPAPPRQPQVSSPVCKSGCMAGRQPPHRQRDVDQDRR